MTPKTPGSTPDFCSFSFFPGSSDPLFPQLVFSKKKNKKPRATSNAGPAAPAELQELHLVEGLGPHTERLAAAPGEAPQRPCHRRRLGGRTEGRPASGRGFSSKWPRPSTSLALERPRRRDAHDQNPSATGRAEHGEREAEACLPQHASASGPLNRLDWLDVGWIARLRGLAWLGIAKKELFSQLSRS